MPPGQTHIYPSEGSARGQLVLDGWVFPPKTGGILQEPITVSFDDRGDATVLGDSATAREVADWVKSVGDPYLNHLCHVSYGFHPRVLRPYGALVRDERHFGSLCIGLGAPMPYRSHLDFGLRFPTVLAADQPIQRDGRYLDGELQDLARRLAVPGY